MEIGNLVLKCFESIQNLGYPNRFEKEELRIELIWCKDLLQSDSNHDNEVHKTFEYS